MIQKGDPKLIRAWTFYDWANSVHSLVITTAIFPLYYAAVAVTTVRDGERYVELFGTEFNSTSLISFTGSLTFLIICLFLPLLSGIADYTDSKKKFLRAFCYLGAFSCMGLYFFRVEWLALGLVIYMLALIGFWGSIVFYNSYLPLIAEPKDHDQVSAKGYSMGYIGSALLLICLLVLIQLADMPVKYAFVITGIWWIGFAQITLRNLPSGTKLHSTEKRKLSKGYDELREVWRQLKKTQRLKKYLRAFFIYSMGVQTVMLVAVYFGEEEIEWGSHKEFGLIISVLLIQFIAIPGAHFMARVSHKYGNLKALMISNLIWVILCIVAMFVHTPIQFYITAAFVGFVMGGIQSMSRSTYAKFLPETRDTASFFSFYEVSEKLGIVFGLFIFALLEQLGDMRTSIVSLIVFFALGLYLLTRVPKEEVPITMDH